MRTISCALFILHIATITYAMERNSITTWLPLNEATPIYTNPGHTYFINNILEAIEKGAPANLIYSLAMQGAPLSYQRSLRREGTFSVMHVAVELGDIAAVDALLSFDPRLAKLLDFRKWTPADYARKLSNIPLQHLFCLNELLMSEQSSEAQLRKIIEKGRKAGIDDDFYLSLSLFHRAAIYGKKEAVKVLLEVNPKLGFQLDFNGYTAYQYVTAKNNQEIMSMLPQYVPNLSNEEKLAHEGFMSAVASGDEEEVEDRIDTIKHLKFARSQGGYDPLQLAIASFVSSDLISLLFTQKLFKEENGTSIYHFAVKANNLKAIKTLSSIDKAFQKNITMIDHSGQTPAELARALGRDFEAIATYLENAVAQPEESSFLNTLVSTIFSSHASY